MTVSLARTSAGTILSVGNAPTTYDAAGFAAVSFTQVAELTNVGAYGKKFNVVKHNPIDTRLTVKRRGSADAGTLSLKGASTSDSGQSFLKTALASDNSVSFKITLPDGRINYFTGQIISFITDVGGVDQILGFTVDVELDNEIISV